MNEKEIAELRRRFRPEKSCISRIRGGCINEKKELVSEFDQPLGMLPEQEAEELLALLKKTLSGKRGRTLTDIEFSTQQVLDSDEHQLLMTLRDTALSDEEAVHKLYAKIAENVFFDGSYMILLAADRYDVPAHAKDGARSEEGDEVFSYIVCAVCPMKLTRAALGYQASERRFRSVGSDWALTAPEAGFLFPAFDDRSANIYGALYYSKNTADNHPELAEALFHAPLPVPAEVQRETFSRVLEGALADGCGCEVLSTLCGRLAVLAADAKEEGGDVTVTKEAVSEVLAVCGISEERVAAFGAQFDEAFGAGAALQPDAVVDVGKFELKTPDVTIRVNPERTDLIETRILDGVKYILVRAGDGVEVNGVDIHIKEEQ